MQQADIPIDGDLVRGDPAARSDRLLEFMVGRGLLERGAAERVQAAMLRSGQSVDLVLSELGLLGEANLVEAQAAFLDLKTAGPADFPNDPVTLPQIEPDFLRRVGVLPLRFCDQTLEVATARPMENDPIRSIGYFLDTRVSVRVAARSEMEAAFQRLYGEVSSGIDPEGGGRSEASDDDLERLKDVAREAPIVRLVNRITGDAIQSGASDIHLEPTEAGLRVRYRIDGDLRPTETLGRSEASGVVTRLKILANLNLAERRLPQDGRMKIAVRGRDIDLRVSTTPTLHGESVVLRILDRGTVALDLARLGFDPAEQDAIRGMIGNPNGIVLVTGPTGSGKTTTLYAALLALNREDAKIFTIEDPIEYQLAGINQIQVKPAIGLDFAAGLRSVLRQDPDIVMIGEIRDAETARIAVQSALTGHLVLATLHTNSAVASVTRLLDMGIEPYLVASTLRGIVAQRLVRKTCRSCSSSEKTTAPGGPGPTRRTATETDRLPAAAPSTCAICHGTGFSGRTTIAEILRVDAGIRDLIHRQAPEAEIQNVAETLGMRSLQQSGMAKARAGETTLDEVHRVTRIA